MIDDTALLGARLCSSDKRAAAVRRAAGAGQGLAVRTASSSNNVPSAVRFAIASVACRRAQQALPAAAASCPRARGRGATLNGIRKGTTGGDAANRHVVPQALRVAVAAG